jgi:uncharacterized protein YbjT (DUF2867 family)
MSIKKILITGATGYIGRRLSDNLTQNPSLAVRLFVRNTNKVCSELVPDASLVEGDTFDVTALDKALDDIDTAFYLVHTNASENGNGIIEQQSAKNFRDACIRKGVKRIIYLGGLGNSIKPSAEMDPGAILSAKPDVIQTIWLRAGAIIGAGSACFEIITSLVQKLPLMVTPRWVKSKTVPIALDDVLAYLESAIFLESLGNLQIDLGSEEMSFTQMMKTAGKVLNLYRPIIHVPVLTRRLSSVWLIIFTPVPYRMASGLISKFTKDIFIQNARAIQYFPEIKVTSFEKAFEQALRDCEENKVPSRWTDASDRIECDIKEHKDLSQATLRDVRTCDIGSLPPEKVFASALSVGGKNGWFTYSFLWKFRGIIDKAVGGYGMNRGRRHSRELRVGDALDFWKVADIETNKRILLLAQMKVPGRAWLEFDINKHFLVVTAHFEPRGIWGLIYWYSFLPAHSILFPDLASQIVKRATTID